MRTGGFLRRAPLARRPGTGCHGSAAGPGGGPASSSSSEAAASAAPSPACDGRRWRRRRRGGGGASAARARGPSAAANRPTAGSARRRRARRLDAARPRRGVAASQSTGGGGGGGSSPSSDCSCASICSSSAAVRSTSGSAGSELIERQNRLVRRAIRLDLDAGADRLQLGDDAQRDVLGETAAQAQARTGEELRTVVLGDGMQRLDALQQLGSLVGIFLGRRGRPVHPDVEEDRARRQERLRRDRSR